MHALTHPHAHNEACNIRFFKRRKALAVEPAMEQLNARLLKTLVKVKEMAVQAL